MRHDIAIEISHNRVDATLRINGTIIAGATDDTGTASLRDMIEPMVALLTARAEADRARRRTIPVH